jgi:hypothetical protein
VVEFQQEPIHRTEVTPPMTRVASIFSQILQMFPGSEFEAAVEFHKAERHARGFPCWGQFIAMLFCQLGRAHSLREICQGLAASEGKRKHLGLTESPNRSTLSYANAHRPWQLFEMLFQILYARCQAEAAGKGTKFSFQSKLLSIDSTAITVAKSAFEWAQYSRRKGALKIHLLLDHDGHLPRFAVITDGKQSDISVAMGMRFEPGTILVFDRGYIRYGWWVSLTKNKVWFVSRLRDNGVYNVVKENPVPAGGAVTADRTIVFPAQKRQGEMAHFRLVEVQGEDGTVLEFVTNAHPLEAQTVADLYRQRWQI